MSLQGGLTVRRTKKLVASVFAATLMGITAAAPASAQPVVTGGLVNVTIVDVIDDVTVVVRDVNVGVGVAANVAALLCDTADINAAVLATQVVRDAEEVTCKSGDQTITFRQIQR
jgi:hypothetical protein